MQTNNANLFAELLMCSTALGAGVIPPFEDLYRPGGMIFASAVSDTFKFRVNQASSEFSRSTVAAETEIRRRIQQLETDVTHDVEGSVQQLEEARAQLDFTRYPFCFDFNATRDMVLEQVARSRHKHVTLMDDRGFRLGMSLKFAPSFVRESSLLPTTASFSMSQTTIRIHGTGGSVQHNICAGVTPAFTYFSAPPVELAESLIDKLSKNAILSPFKGYAVIIAEEPLKAASVTATTEDLLRLLNNYYTLGNAKDDERARYELESDSLRNEWRSFLGHPDTLKLLEVPEKRMQRAAKLLSSYHLKPEVAASFATKAVLCKAVLDAGATGKVFQLTSAHLQLAREFFKVLFAPMMRHVQTADRLSENAAKASAARRDRIPSPAKQEEAIESLTEAIQAAPGNMISRRTATRLPKVTAAMLDYLVANREEVVEMCGRSEIKMGVTDRAYTLRDMYVADIEEAMDDFAEAKAVFEQNHLDPMFDEMETVRHELMDIAQATDRGPIGLPVVPLNKMTSRQIRALPAILHEHPHCFVMRGTPENPELPHLVRTVTDPDAPLDPGIPVVWVRRSVSGADLRDWKLAVRLGFAEVWT